eukprot:1245578-Pleurochrysis_carterae.AAC.1
MEANSGVAGGHDAHVVPITLQTYRPALRPNGSERRPPVAQGGDSKARVLPKRHSVEVDSQ